MCAATKAGVQNKRHMPRYLYLLRHAQSADKQAGQRDIDRTLTVLGTKQAGRIAAFLSQEKTYPDLIISSTAERAKSTSWLIAEGLGMDRKRIVFEPLLYEASTQTFLQIINSQSDSFTHILYVAHNPTISYLAEYLTKKEIREMVPAALTLIQFDCESWQQVSGGTGEFLKFVQPNEITY